MDLLRAGAPQRKKLDSVQAQIVARRAEIDETIHAESADADLRENCRRAVCAEMERVRPAGEYANLRRSAAFLDAMDFPGMARYQNTVMPGLTWGTLFYLFGEDRAVDVVFEAAKRGATSSPGLPNAEREKRIAELRDELRKLERAEEIETLKLETQGFAVLRRDDVDPETVFAVWSTYSDTPAPETEAA